jgi:hypothetical protein
VLTPGQKHFTSKLSTFENLDILETFGFRGEALSSLCALADVEITTATRDQVPLATKLDFDHHGKIISQKVASAKVYAVRLELMVAWHNGQCKQSLFDTSCAKKRIFKKFETGIRQGYYTSSSIRINFHKHQIIRISSAPEWVPSSHSVLILGKWVYNYPLMVIKLCERISQISSGQRSLGLSNRYISLLKSMSVKLEGDIVRRQFKLLDIYQKAHMAKDDLRLIDSSFMLTRGRVYNQRYSRSFLVLR